MRLAIVLALLLSTAALARDNGQWGNSDHAIRQWYQSLMRPDYPIMSCCGEADAYWADSYEVDGESYVAIITDDREDAPLGRPHVDIGTRVKVPNIKMKYDQGNPTGHGVIFLRFNEVLCYVVPGGV